MVRIDNLSYRHNETNVLNFSNRVFEPDAHTLILGQSGSGKTTLLHLLGGLLRPTAGSIVIGDIEIHNLKPAQLDHFRGKNIGFVFQTPHLIQDMNVEENLFLAQYLAGLPKDRNRVKEVLEKLNLSAKSKSRVYALSEGQAQRVVLARAILNRPQLILADEPTSSLDDKHCDRVINLLLEQAQAHGACLIIATHDQRLKNKITHQMDLSAA